MIGRILGNRYEIIEKIGGGGMSNVYKAKCGVLNRFVAIKILRDELISDPDFVEKFKQESLSAASLAHPNIVNIYDTGIDGNIYYIVMEYVKGETLKEYINKKGRLSEAEAVRITKQIAEALKHAHMNNIIHRDIKPHNILLTEEGVAKVTDFGIAKVATTATINNTSNVIGSVHYFSPEQARGGYVDDKSDIYSLGIVMYEMITGVVPFDADNHISVAMKQIQEKPIPPSKKINNLQISKAFEDIIMKCLEKHQSFRFQNVDELIKKLDSLNEFDSSVKTETEIIDSPTMVLPAMKADLNNDEFQNNIVDIDLIDGNSENAFKNFFNEESKEKNETKRNKTNKKDKKDKNKKITIAAILSALVIAIVGGIIVFNAIMYVPEVAVPNLLGRDEQEAEKIIEDLGLLFEVSDREYSSEYEEGKVLEQSVEEGTKLKENYPVKVVVSKGMKNITVPNLIGKYAIEAGLILAEEGLEEGRITEQNSDTYPAGQIIDQYPSANNPAQKDDNVDYVISTGPKVIYVKMPNLTGLEIETAKLLIIQNNLGVGEITQEPSEDVNAGLVMRQSVAPDQEVEQGASIWMTVSSGKSVDEPNNPGEEPVIPEENQSETGTYPLTIKLPTDKDKVSVVVQRITDDGREIVYSKEVSTSEQSIIVNIQGTGTQMFEIYIDNNLYDKTEITFE
ncbi:MAG: Stk1 family PASTA domain-containing Ser/Thr kinase [Sedimentibacter sp.]